MCVIVNIDLVVSAVIYSELAEIRRIAGGQAENQDCEKAITVSPDRVMRYARQLKFSDLGRIVINFGREDVAEYLDENSKIFRRVGESQVYRLAPVQTGQKGALDGMLSKLNYSDRVLRTVGLLNV